MKSNVKAFLAGLLALSIALACACGKKEEETTKKKSKKTSSTTTETTLPEEPTEEPSESTKESTAESTTESTTESTAESSTGNQEKSSASESYDAPSSFSVSTADDYMTAIDFDGVVLVAEGDQILYSYVAGLADRSNGIANEMDTVFEFGSITKQFTAIAIMQLEEAGKLSTEDKLDKYLPEYSHAGEITIHQLLNMTSGIPDYLYSGALGISLDFQGLSLSDLIYLEDTLRKVVTTPVIKSELVNSISLLPLNFAPGSQYEYSNTNYYFLGMIIEQLSGMSYDEYIRKNILEPLSLKEIYPDIDHLTSCGRTDLGLMKYDLPSQDPSISFAAGVMTGTANGLWDWEKCVMDGALLSPESWKKILDGGTFGYGYGWSISSGFIEHSGMTLGYNTCVRVDSKTRRVIIVLSNIQPLTGTPKRPMSSDIADRLWTLYS